MKTNKLALWIFLFPALFLLAVFAFLPIVASIIMSFFRVDIQGLLHPSTIQFVGIRYYTDVLFHGSLLYKALLNTIIVLVIAMPLTIIISLVLAVMVGSKMTKGGSVLRVGFFLPAVTNTIAISLVWKWLLNGNNGLFNYILSFVGIKGPDWLNNQHTAIFTIIMLVIWESVGPNAILYMAALSSIPDSVKEAAEIDGATAWSKFMKIYVPMLVPTTTYVSIMSLIGYLQIFSEPYMLTGGGPVNSTISIVMVIYNEAFQNFNFGYASALSIVLFFLVFVLSLIHLKIRKLDL